MHLPRLLDRCGLRSVLCCDKPAPFLLQFALATDHAVLLVVCPAVWWSGLEGAQTAQTLLSMSVVTMSVSAATAAVMMLVMMPTKIEENGCLQPEVLGSPLSLCTLA